MSNTVALPIPEPNGDSRPYWDAARERRLVIRRCSDCGAKHFMARYLCPQCWSDRLEWIDSEGNGTVASFSIVHRAPTAPFKGRTPYVVALIDLDEGPRMFANIVGDDAHAVAIGERVHVTFEERDGMTIPQFARAAR